VDSSLPPVPAPTSTRSSDPAAPGPQRPRLTPSRRSVLGASSAALAALGLAACGGGGGASTGLEEQELQLPTYIEPKLPEGGRASDVEGVPTMFTEPIKEYFTSVDEAPGSGNEVTTFQVLWGAPPRKRDKSEYWQELEKRLNITFSPTLVASDGYNDKLSTTIASGKIADLTFVQDTDAIGLRAIDDGAFADLSETLAGDNIKQWPNLANVATGAWKASAKNGHIYGVPNENPYLANYPMVRSDLVKLAGHDSMGSNTDEFLEVMTDIAKLKEAHGKKIWGMAGIDGLAQSMFEWMFRAGTTWQLDDDDKIINVLQTDAFGDVMEYEATLWKNGVIHPDGIGGDLPDMFKPGQIALTLDSFQGFFGDPIIGEVLKSTPEAETEFFVPPAFDGGDIVIQRDDGYWGIVAISSEAAEDEDRLHELLGILNYWRGPYGSEENLFIESGIEGVNYTFGKNHEIEPLNDDKADGDLGALQWLGCFTSPTYQVPTALKGYADNFYETIEKLIGATVPNPVAGKIAPSAAKINAKLDQLNEDWRNGFITGRKKLSDMDKYRDAWLKAGGQTICDEYTEVLDKEG
jgi:putative aldouronate transport system substrate-binding protein